ncbi:hypothetical protein [Glutamicibacter protophormiae]|uniref:hypothetical protein n=1 Tax=Glutamicibacter protophormiae TaxID=37930 RepID=UPI00195EA06B|nr:hypothetical protein [Glutamicibacter protophormiae]QRQ78612.1 hypothetical protein JQN66_17255 [Glutamicibacter protophormiae]
MPQDYVIDEFRIDLDLDDPSTLFGPVSEECLEFQSDRDERYVELSTVLRTAIHREQNLGST